MKKQLLFILAALMLSLSANAQMVLEFNTKLSDGTTIMLPLYGTVNVTVDWGDSKSDSYTTASNHKHEYTVEGTYTVSISGSLTQFGNGFDETVKLDKLVKVTSFGNIGLTSLFGAFANAINLIEVPSLLPSTVISTKAMFADCKLFNQDIGSWDVSKVTDMSSMFENATLFNQNIGGWNVSKVKDMDYMFRYAYAFDQDIGGWKVNEVNLMQGLFQGTTSFNQDISRWNVSKVTDMWSMFDGASSFNQNIGSWDVSSVTRMNYMFDGASSFNQNIGSWDVSNVTNMLRMFNGVTLSTDNYNKLLIGWAKQNVENGVVFNGGKSKYSTGAAADARAVLTGTYGWTITDGGLSSASAVTSAVNDNIGVYPNPFRNEIRISNASDASRIVITNVLGKVVLDQPAKQVIEINLPSSVYLISIIAHDGSKVLRKMIRE